jgi:hypothetical protein
MEGWRPHGGTLCRFCRLATSSALGSAEYAVQSLHECVRHSRLQICQNARQLVLDHLRQLHHRGDEAGLLESSDPVHPAAPHFESTPCRRRMTPPIDVLDYQPYLVSLGRAQIPIFNPAHARLFVVRQVLGIFASEHWLWLRGSHLTCSPSRPTPR